MLRQLLVHLQLLFTTWNGQSTLVLLLYHIVQTMTLQLCICFQANYGAHFLVNWKMSPRFSIFLTVSPHSIKYKKNFTTFCHHNKFSCNFLSGTSLYHHMDKVGACDGIGETIKRLAWNFRCRLLQRFHHFSVLNCWRAQTQNNNAQKTGQESSNTSAYSNKMFCEELITYFFSLHTEYLMWHGPIQNTASNNSSTVVCVFIAMENVYWDFA